VTDDPGGAHVAGLLDDEVRASHRVADLAGDLFELAVDPHLEPERDPRVPPRRLDDRQDVAVLGTLLHVLAGVGGTPAAAVEVRIVDDRLPAGSEDVVDRVPWLEQGAEDQQVEGGIPRTQLDQGRTGLGILVGLLAQGKAKRQHAIAPA